MAQYETWLTAGIMAMKGMHIGAADACGGNLNDNLV